MPEFGLPHRVRNESHVKREHEKSGSSGVAFRNSLYIILFCRDCYANARQRYVIGRVLV